VQISKTRECDQSNSSYARTCQEKTGIREIQDAYHLDNHPTIIPIDAFHSVLTNIVPSNLKVKNAPPFVECGSICPTPLSATAAALINRLVFLTLRIDARNSKGGPDHKQKLDYSHAHIRYKQFSYKSSGPEKSKKSLLQYQLAAGFPHQHHVSDVPLYLRIAASHRAGPHFLLHGHSIQDLFILEWEFAVRRFFGFARQTFYPS
jgi:hypothetical protein